MTCACSADIAQHVLPHQALTGNDADTHEDVPVTDPLVGGVCFDCRGQNPPAFPRAPQRGASSAIHRYYWHELWLETTNDILTWCRDAGLPLLDESGEPQIWTHRQNHRAEFDRIEAEVLSRVRQQHATSPKYDISRPSDADILIRYAVDVLEVPACYVEPTQDGRVHVVPVGATDATGSVPVEDYIAALQSAAGREAMELESRPFHCLFGTLMWMWVEDLTDSRSRPAYFGRRDPEPETDIPSPGGQGSPAFPDGLLRVVMPADFGTPNHANRRRAELEEHLSQLPDETAELLWTFDYWVPYSENLRQYLWAHEADDMARAREVIRVLGAPAVIRLMLALANGYWDRYLGWPDLLTWVETDEGPADPLLIEVKSRGDRLSEDQRAWIKLNATELHLPFELAKVHRTERVAR